MSMCLPSSHPPSDVPGFPRWEVAPPPFGGLPWDGRPLEDRDPLAGAPSKKDNQLQPWPPTASPSSSSPSSRCSRSSPASRPPSPPTASASARDPRAPSASRASAARPRPAAWSAVSTRPTRSCTAARQCRQEEAKGDDGSFKSCFDQHDNTQQYNSAASKR
ncbi:hypothetical protein DFJ74DRAFT_399805, partial [Hyaloraphidium curvatum]